MDLRKLICLFRDQGTPGHRISHGKIFRHLLHERGLPVHGGGHADLPERSGHSLGPYDVHGLADGLAVYCLLGKEPHYYNNNQLELCYDLVNSQ